MASDLLESIFSDHESTVKLRDELRDSLCLMKLWPTVFRHGPAKSKWTSRKYRKGANTQVAICFTITDADGEAKHFDPWDVDDVLNVYGLFICKGYFSPPLNTVL